MHDFRKTLVLQTIMITHHSGTFHPSAPTVDHPQSLTCGHRADQQRVQSDQRAEGGLGVPAAPYTTSQPAGRAAQQQPVVGTPLEQDQGVRQQQRLDLWWEGRGETNNQRVRTH